MSVGSRPRVAGGRYPAVRRSPEEGLGRRALAKVRRMVRMELPQVALPRRRILRSRSKLRELGQEKGVLRKAIRITPRMRRTMRMSAPNPRNLAEVG